MGPRHTHPPISPYILLPAPGAADGGARDLLAVEGDDGRRRRLLALEANEGVALGLEEADLGDGAELVEGRAELLLCKGSNCKGKIE